MLRHSFFGNFTGGFIEGCGDSADITPVAALAREL
jgi:hypothetical protein